MTAAEQIQAIAADYGVTAEIMQMQDDLYAMWDAWQAAYEAELGEAPFEARREVGV